jgi:glycosyltransferase involved in cell wall biosynthesis
MYPKVTVITPTYNCARFLKETIESVLNQDYPDLEYIIINDGSTDETQELLKDYQGEATVINQDNCGEQNTVNRGMAIAEGKYFMIVNADDPLYPGAIEKMVACMELNPHILCAYPDWDVIDDTGRVTTHVQTREYDFPWMVAHQNCIPGVGSIFRSSIIQWIGYRNESYRWLGDYDFWLRIGLAGQMMRVPIILARWRNHEGQASKAKSDLRAQEHIRVYEEFFKMNVPKQVRQVEAQAKSWSYLIAATLTPDKKSVIEYILRALDYEPFVFEPGFWDATIRRALYILRR